MTRSRSLAFALVVAAGGCASGPRPDAVTACRMVHTLGGVQRASIKDLVDLSRGTPAEGQAVSAYAQQISAGVIGGLAGGALLAALVVGLATNTGVNYDAHNAALGLGGAALGLTALTVTLGYTAPYTANKARQRLTAFSDRCQ